uniref:Uncharacterized protein n=1 Tax=Anguilla anguilla TaxID=7936 RepID=A0A0E9QS74_ANGAN
MNAKLFTPFRCNCCFSNTHGEIIKSMLDLFLKKAKYISLFQKSYF